VRGDLHHAGDLSLHLLDPRFRLQADGTDRLGRREMDPLVVRPYRVRHLGQTSKEYGASQRDGALEQALLEVGEGLERVADVTKRGGLDRVAEVPGAEVADRGAAFDDIGGVPVQEHEVPSELELLAQLPAEPLGGPLPHLGMVPIANAPPIAPCL